MQKTKFDLTKVSLSSLDKFKELDKSKYTPEKKPKKISRSPFDAGLEQIRTTFG